MISSFPKGFTHPMRAGQGGFASVYRVRQEALDRWVAVKVLTEKDAGKRRELLREGKTQARLEIRAVPQVYDALEWKGRVYIVMQWIKGARLSDLLLENPDCTRRKKLAYGFADALTTLHERGFAHRDLKPANTIISPDRGVLFVDFGFSKNVSDGLVSVEGLVKGTPAYMAPELWRRNAEINHIRADVFSAGRVLGEILQGCPEAQMIIDRLTAEEPSRRPGCGAEIRDLLREGGITEQPRLTWREVAEPCSSLRLSSDLVRAAQELLCAGRSDEAYWLLVESLEENPENADAVSLVNSFARFRRMGIRKKRLWYGAAATLALTLGIAGYMLGRESGTTVVVAPEEGGNRSAPSELLLTPTPQQTPHRRLPFLADTIHDAGLRGRVFIERLPEKGVLVVDYDTLLCRNVRVSGLFLKPGKHTLSLLAGNGNTWWRQKISILPFETKIISIPREKPS